MGETKREERRGRRERRRREGRRNRSRSPVGMSDSSRRSGSLSPIRTLLLSPLLVMSNQMGGVAAFATGSMQTATAMGGSATMHLADSADTRSQQRRQPRPARRMKSSSLPPRFRDRRNKPVSSSGTALGMLPDLECFDLGAAVTETASNAAECFGDFCNNLMSDPEAKVEAEAEAMNFVSHALMDFPLKVVQQAATAARAAEVAGRLFALGQAMLPGHELPPDELAFQVAFLAVSCNTLYQTVVPKVKAAQACKFLTPEDRKAYRELFKPAGLSWMQYRELKINHMEWVDLKPGEEIGTDDAYWMYAGNAQIGDVEASGLIGEDHIARTLGFFDGDNTSTPVVGTEGAKALKMNTQELKQTIKNDKNLQGPMSRLLYNNMQQKIQQASLTQTSHVRAA